MTNSPNYQDINPDLLDDEVREHITEIAALMECATDKNTRRIDVDVERIAAEASVKAATALAIYPSANRSQFLVRAAADPIGVAVDLIRDSHEDALLETPFFLN